MSTLGIFFCTIGTVAFASWLLVALIMGWRLMWFRRKSMNKNMATVYRQYGEEFRPVGRLRWAWIVVRSIPMLLSLTAFGILAFLLHIPAAIWSLMTGKPIPPPDLPPRDQSKLDNDAA